MARETLYEPLTVRRFLLYLLIAPAMLLLLRATNVGHRIVAPEGRLCAEFFEPDTGRRIRLDCGSDRL